ncbi:heat- and acid-stable phosphoprotein [Mortierella sp. AM989]|nr:heat- and acid-stable phosphoprotein [Mortierella sp. AM989]
MAGGKFKKPQRGGGRKFSRRIEAVHTTTQPNVDRDGKGTPLSESESESESDIISRSESESESEQGFASSTMVSPIPGIQVNNPNHLAPIVNKRQKNKLLDMNTPIEMSRKEREAAEKEAAKQRYWKLHQEGKTDEAKADMARLAVIRKQREEAAAKRLAETKAKEDNAAAKIGLTPSMRF